MLKNEVEEKQLTGNLVDIAKDLRFKFDVDPQEMRANEDTSKRSVKKEEILSITRLQEGRDPQ